MSKIQREYLTEKEVEALTGFSIKTLQRWRLMGSGPRFRKINNYAVRYHLDELRYWLDSQPTGGALGVAEDSMTTSRAGNSYSHIKRRCAAYGRRP